LPNIVVSFGLSEAIASGPLSLRVTRHARP
jgi:hypothetical protein